MTPAKPNSLEIRREKWLRQLLADPKIEFSHFRVATVIGWHMNRSRGGVAWPGIKTIAKIACIDRRTVMRAIRWLEARDHLGVTRARKGKRNLANRYLPTLQQRGRVANDALPCHQVGAQLRHHLGGIAMSPEPYTEPLTEPPIRINISATSSDVAVHKGSQQGKEESGIRGSEGKDPTSIESPSHFDSLRGECYRLARDNYGDRGAALVTKALQSSDTREILAEIEAAIEAGDDLGHVLWRP
jgi:hypothetical protein